MRAFMALLVLAMLLCSAAAMIFLLLYLLGMI